MKLHLLVSAVVLYHERIYMHGFNKIVDLQFNVPLIIELFMRF